MIKYEYLVTYNSKSGLSLWQNQRGRIIKQTLKGANDLVAWATRKGYKVKLQRRVVGAWEEIDGT